MVANMERTVAAFKREDLAGLKSNDVLRRVAPALEADGWQIETRGKLLFGWFEVDGWHEKRRAVLEVEAGRATESNAIYRNILRTLTLDNVRTLVMAVPFAYRSRNRVAHYHRLTTELAERLEGRLPFELLIIGYRLNADGKIH